MPVFHSGEVPPAWCELDGFEILDLTEGAVIDQARRGSVERLLVTSGTVQLAFADSTLILKENQFFDPVGAPSWRLRCCSAKAQLVRLFGRWGRDLGGCGIFRVAEQERPVNTGDPVTYVKRTSVDAH